MTNPSDESSGQADASKSKAPRSQSLNLGKLESDRYRLSIESLELPEVRNSRLRREEADSEHRRHMEVLILWAILITVGEVSVICLGIVPIPGYPADNVKWATTLLTMIVSGGLGYMTGRNSRSAE